jgi:ADP-heptose:LPS heptosyltransferase
MKEYERILIITGPGIGDNLLSVPFINMMREYYPNAQIDSMSLVNRTKPGLSEGFQVLQTHCLLNRRIEIEEATNIVSKGKIILDLIKSNYDLVVDLWPPTKNKTFFSKTISQGKIAGFTEKHDIHIIPKNEHKVVLEAKLLTKITGVKSSENIPYPKIIIPDKKLNIITVSVSRDDDPLRSWPIERWAELLNRIKETYKMDIMFLGADVNRGRITEISKLLTSVPIASFNELPRLQIYISKAKLHLSENCGVMHIATTTTTPIISISQSEKGWAPYGKQNVEVRGKTMNDITVEDVWKEIKKKL